MRKREKRTSEMKSPSEDREEKKAEIQQNLEYWNECKRHWLK